MEDARPGTAAEQIREKIPDEVSIFILPPNRSELEKRLRERGQNREDDIQRRLDDARREIENYEKYDYILVNDRLDESVEGLKAIVLSERLRRSGQEDRCLSARAEMYRLKNIRERVQPILQSFREVAAGGGK